MNTRSPETVGISWYKPEEKHPTSAYCSRRMCGGHVYPEKSGHCPQVPSQKWDMQERRTYSNSKDSHPSGPSKSCTVEIILFRDKVSSLLSDSAEEGKLTHLLRHCDPWATCMLFECPPSPPSKKPKPKSSHSPNNDIQQHKCTRN